MISSPSLTIITGIPTFSFPLISAYSGLISLYFKNLFSEPKDSVMLKYANLMPFSSRNFLAGAQPGHKSEPKTYILFFLILSSYLKHKIFVPDFYDLYQEIHKIISIFSSLSKLFQKLLVY